MFEGVSDSQLESWFDEYEELARKLHQTAAEVANSGVPNAMLAFRKLNEEAGEWSTKAGAIVEEMRRRGHKLFPNG